MRELTSVEIDKLASKKGARRVAVENFLGTLDASIGYGGNMRNAWADRDSYQWKSPTIAAIESGIRKAFKV